MDQENQLGWSGIIHLQVLSREPSDRDTKRKRYKGRICTKFACREISGERDQETTQQIRAYRENIVVLNVSRAFIECTITLELALG